MYWNPEYRTSWNPGGGAPSGNPPMHIKWIQQTERIIHYFLIKVRVSVCLYHCLGFLYIPPFLFPCAVVNNHVYEFGLWIFCSVLLATALLYGSQKTMGSVATGTVEVLTYYIPDIGKTLAVIFSVPFNYNLYSNWFDVWLYSGKVSPATASYSLWKELYYDDPFKRDINIWNYRYLQGSGLWVRCAMSNMGQATIEIHIF